MRAFTVDADVGIEQPKPGDLDVDILTDKNRGAGSADHASLDPSARTLRNAKATLTADNREIADRRRRRCEQRNGEVRCSNRNMRRDDARPGEREASTFEANVIKNHVTVDRKRTVVR